jgi:hypothetical protein
MSNGVGESATATFPTDRAGPTERLARFFFAQRDCVPEKDTLTWGFTPTQRRLHGPVTLRRLTRLAHLA